MAGSDVRSIEALSDFHRCIVGLAADWDRTLQEIRMTVQRAESHFSQDLPAYWRRQTKLAERELTEARDNLSRKRASIRPEDRPAATEAVKRVQAGEARLRECDAKRRTAKAWSIEIGQQCDDMLGPISDLADHCQVVLPSAARELATLITQLKLYAEQSKQGE